MFFFGSSQCSNTTTSNSYWTILYLEKSTSQSCAWCVCMKSKWRSKSGYASVGGSIKYVRGLSRICWWSSFHSIFCLDPRLSSLSLSSWYKGLTVWLKLGIDLRKEPIKPERLLNSEMLVGLFLIFDVSASVLLGSTVYTFQGMKLLVWRNYILIVLHLCIKAWLQTTLFSLHLVCTKVLRL